MSGRGRPKGSKGKGKGASQQRDAPSRRRSLSAGPSVGTRRQAAELPGEPGAVDADGAGPATEPALGEKRSRSGSSLPKRSGWRTCSYCGHKARAGTGGAHNLATCPKKKAGDDPIPTYVSKPKRRKTVKAMSKTQRLCTTLNYVEIGASPAPFVSFYDLETDGVNPRQCRLLKLTIATFPWDPETLGEARAIIIERGLREACDEISGAHLIDTYVLPSPGFDPAYKVRGENGNFVVNGAFEKHGITKEDLVGAPGTKQALEMVRTELEKAAPGGTVLVAHNGWSFDWRVLTNHYNRHRVPLPRALKHHVDTMHAVWWGGFNDLPGRAEALRDATQKHLKR